MQDAALTIQQFIAAYKVGRTRTYEEISTGRLPTYRVGRRRFISSRAADEWQLQLEKESAKTPQMAVAA